MTFGDLFTLTDNSFEALNGTLSAARRAKIVSYEGETLFQGQQDDTLIVLKHTEEHVVRQLLAVAARRVDVSRKKKLHPPPQLELTHQYQLPNCFACSKKVYPQEYTTAAGHPLHKACLKCEVCHHSLSAVTYCCYDNTHFFCRKHYMQAAALNQELDDLSTPTPIKLRENEGRVHGAGHLHGSSSHFRKAHTRSASIVSHASSSAFDAVKTRCGLIVDYEDTDQLQPLEQLPPRLHTTNLPS